MVMWRCFGWYGGGLEEGLKGGERLAGSGGGHNFFSLEF